MATLRELTPKPGDDRRVEAGHPIMDAACFVAGRWEWVADGSAVTVTRDTLSDDWQLVTPEPPEPEVERWPLVGGHLGRDVKGLCAMVVGGCCVAAERLALLTEWVFLGFEGKLPNGDEWPVRGASWLWWSDYSGRWLPQSKEHEGPYYNLRAITPIDGGEAWALMRRIGDD